MDGSNDFRPDIEQRASDPSLAEMLRRARDAHLGDTYQTTGDDWLPGTPFPAVQRRGMRGEWLQGCVTFVLGIIIGVLGTYAVVNFSTPMSNTRTLAPVVATATPPATATDPPILTPTSAPTATSGIGPLPTSDEIVALAQGFYDRLGPFAGTYVLRDATGVQVWSRGDAQLTVCVAYEFAAIASPDTVAGTDTRTFTLIPGGNGTWQMVAMGTAGSCSLT